MTENVGLVDALDRLADHEKNEYKKSAYRNAAEAIYNLSFVVTNGEELSTGPNKVPGIGKSIAKKIDEYLKTGKISRSAHDMNFEVSKTKNKNVGLVDALDRLADHEKNEYKKSAYRNAAEAIYNLSFVVTNGEELSAGPNKVPGIGKSIAKKIDEYLKTGKLKRL